MARLGKLDPTQAMPSPLQPPAFSNASSRHGALRVITLPALLPHSTTRCLSLILQVRSDVTLHPALSWGRVVRQRYFRTVLALT
jgi:hypothetical protein